ncbi:LysR family transcriptional regulator [Dongshaea marina]|uniref:LysR family transcriptional regulator n=1 Tax=Dongshaea marina TaxID=2047966 RepID=UPI00131F419B|nr:LysR family transcriptional regulator [Dongshaea marina]
MKGLVQLKVFCKVAETGNLTEAGRLMELSPSSVSRQLQALENELAVRLFHRSTHHVGLTEAGQFYYQKASKVLLELQDTHELLLEYQSGPIGTLRISTTQGFANFYLGHHIPDFLEKYPKINLDIQVSDQMVDLIQENIDLAIRYHVPDDSSLIARKFQNTEKMVICASPTYFMRRGYPASPEDLKKHNCLCCWIKNSNRWIISHEGEKHKIHVSGNLRSDNIPLLLSQAVSGLGVIMAPLWMVDNLLRDGSLLQIFSEYRSQLGSECDRFIYAVYPHRAHLPSKVRVFLDYLIECYS